jgi:hypothetical protein
MIYPLLLPPPPLPPNILLKITLLSTLMFGKNNKRGFSPRTFISARKNKVLPTLGVPNPYVK